MLLQIFAGCTALVIAKKLWATDEGEKELPFFERMDALRETSKDSYFVYNSQKSALYFGIGDSKLIEEGDKRKYSYRIHGWRDRIPRNGDRFVTEGKTGKLCCLMLYDVEPCGNPDDMFFAHAIAVDFDYTGGYGLLGEYVGEYGDKKITSDPQPPKTDSNGPKL